MGTFKNPDVWKQNLAYQIGDFVLYNGTVYMAIKPVPAGTEMSSDYWYAFAEGAIVPTGEISITENGEVDVKKYATANVNVEGGGGGDFSTATVTMQAAEGYGSAMTLMCSCIASDYGSIEATGTSAYTEDTSMEFTAVLYKGKALAHLDMPGVNVVVTGSAEYDAIGRSYIITGDCTFTFGDVGENA